jgi:WD40 repeat protein
LIKSFQAHNGWITHIRQSPYVSSYVATCSDDNEVKVWDTTNNMWSLVRAYTNHTLYVRGIEFIDADTIISGAFDNTIRIWSINTGLNKRIINTNNFVWSLKMLNNGVYLACGINSDISIYNINDGNLMVTLSGHGNNVKDLEQISDELLASSSEDHTVRIWNLTTNTCKFILTGHEAIVNGLKLISADLLASGSEDTTIKLWNTTTGDLLRNLTGHTDVIEWSLDLFYSMNGAQQTVLLSGSFDYKLNLWNWQTGELENSINVDCGILSLTVLYETIATAGRSF